LQLQWSANDVASALGARLDEVGAGGRRRNYTQCVIADGGGIRASEQSDSVFCAEAGLERKLSGKSIWGLESNEHGIAEPNQKIGARRRNQEERTEPIRFSEESEGSVGWGNPSPPD